MPKLSTRLAALLVAASISPAALADVSFLDHRGKLIKFESPPVRTAAVIGAGAVLIHRAIEGTSAHIVGTSSDGQRRLGEGVYGMLLPEFKSLNMSLSNDFKPNVEAVLATNADMVIQWTFDPKIIEPLERVGLKVVGWDCCTEQQRRDYLMLTGYATGRIDRAQTILKLEDDSNASLRTTFADLPKDKNVTILEVDQVADQIRVIANSSRDYSLSGVVNQAADGTKEWWRTIDAEQFLVWNPDVIIVSGWQRTVQPSDFYSHPVLANVNAVKNKRVYRIPMFNANPDAPEIHLTAQWLARVTHPDSFKDDFRSIMRDTYNTIYGIQLTDEQIDVVLESEANGQSAGYTQQFGK